MNALNNSKLKSNSLFFALLLFSAVTFITVNPTDAFANFCNTNCNVSCSVESGNCFCESGDDWGYCECIGTNSEGHMVIDAFYNEC